MARATDALLPSVSSSSSSSSDTESETLVMSTGVIGQPLPISKILAALRPHGPLATTLGHGFAAWDATARSFMTTDTFPKLRARTLPLGDGRTYRIAGIDKGAGMIHPDMLGAPPPQSQPRSPPHATLLGCIATDAPVAPATLQSALDYAVQRSFNAISIDGDMSTNDTVVLFANGAGAGDESARARKEPMEAEIDEARDPAAFVRFRDGLTAFMQELAQLVVRDGEGATKFVTVSVEVRSWCSSSIPQRSSIADNIVHNLCFFLCHRPRRVLGHTKTRTRSHRESQRPHSSKPRCTAKTQSTCLHLSPFHPVVQG
jgi:glutamate N-acetyltransferase/amino-acid N-acetyltransferase